MIATSQSEIEFVETELSTLRHLVRIWVAVHNADPKAWFGGSNALQSLMAHALRESILMAIRRQTDSGWKNETGMASLVSVLNAMGHNSAAERLQQNASRLHLQFVADKNIAHAKPWQAAENSGYADSLTGEQITPNQVVEVVHAMSGAFRQHLDPTHSSSLDDLDIGHRDVLFTNLRTVGLPGVDFEFREIWSPASQ